MTAEVLELKVAGSMRRPLRIAGPARKLTFPAVTPVSAFAI